jgi:hypothetical protein
LFCFGGDAGLVISLQIAYLCQNCEDAFRVASLQDGFPRNNPAARTIPIFTMSLDTGIALTAVLNFIPRVIYFACSGLK